MHAGEPRAGAEHDPVGLADRGDRLRAGRRRRRVEATSRRPDLRVVATATWPRTECTPGRALGVDATSATMSSGYAPSAARGRARRAAADPVEALDRVAEQLPQRDDQQVADGVAAQVARRRRTGAGPPRLQVRPQSSSPHSAASAIRRSPGGSTPNSPRSRPLDPPSSATVTTAVSSSVPGAAPERRGQAVAAAERDDRRAGCELDGCPRSLAPQVAVDDAGLDAVAHEPRGELPRPSPRCGACRPCSRRRPSRTACPRAGSRRRDQSRAARRTGRGSSSAPGWAEHVVADRGVEPGAAAQLGDPVRVGQEPAVERPCRRRPAGRTCSRRHHASPAGVGSTGVGERLLDLRRAARGR